MPAGLVGPLHLDAIGAAGHEPGPSANGQTYGGIGAEVSGNLAIGRGTLYAEVGVGGGQANGETPAGGGASDVRRCPTAALFCPGADSSLQSRVLVAGGGGGAGYTGDGGAAFAGSALGLTPQNAVAGEPGIQTLDGGGLGGGGGTGSAGGAGGAPGTVGATIGPAGAGKPGDLGQGGRGGYDGDPTAILGAGSGGGGGYFGGGGGGEGGGVEGGPGGGGSSYVGPIGSPVIAAASVREPSVAITYTEDEPPALTLDTPAPSHTPTFTGTAGQDTGDEPAVTVTVRAGSGSGGPQVLSLETTRDASTGAYAITPPSGLAPGTYTAQATQADAAGNTATTQPVTFTLAGDPPPPPATGSTPAPTSAPGARRAAAALRISSVAPRRCRRGARCTLVVRGWAARSAVGTIAVSVRRGRHGSRRVVVPIRAGRWTSSIVPPVGTSRRVTVIATFRGDAGHLPGTARRAIVLPGHRSAAAS